MKDGTEIYLYAVVGNRQPCPIGLSPDLRFVAEGDLAAVVGTVPDAVRSLVGEEEPDSVLLGDAVRAHEAVVESLLSSTTVVPLRFGTILRSEADVRILLARQAETLSRALRRVEGRAEWSVKILCDARRLSGPSTDEDSASSPGRDYLRRRAAEEGRKVSTLREVSARVAAVAESCSSVADERAAVVPGGSSSPRLIVSELALLIDRRREADLVPVLDAALAEHGTGALTAEVTGPWPPYHFVGELQ